MLQKVILENFQAHEYSEIEFSEGINVISGASDQGKSSVIRAIRWVLENRPSGWAFRRYNSNGPTRVTLIFDTGKIVKSRSDTENNYKVYKGESKKPVELKALRSDVPEEVKEISGFGEYNIQQQFGTSFLIDDSAGEVAKKINQLSGVSIIDNILKETNSRIRAEKSKETATKELLGKLIKSKDAFKNLKRAEKQLKVIEEMHNETEEFKDFHTTLYKYVTALKEIEATPIIDIGKLGNLIQELKESVDSYAEYKDIRGILYNHIVNLQSVNSKLGSCCDTKKANEHIKKAKTALPELTELQNRASKLRSCLANFKRHDAGFKQSVRDAKKAIDDLAAFKKENKVCPVCSKKW